MLAGLTADCNLSVKTFPKLNPQTQPAKTSSQAKAEIQPVTLESLVDELGQLVLSTPKAASQAQVEQWQKILEDFRAFVA